MQIGAIRIYRYWLINKPKFTLTNLCCGYSTLLFNC